MTTARICKRLVRATGHTILNIDREIMHTLKLKQSELQFSQ